MTFGCVKNSKNCKKVSRQQFRSSNNQIQMFRSKLTGRVREPLVSDDPILFGRPRVRHQHQRGQREAQQAAGSRQISEENGNQVKVRLD